MVSSRRLIVAVKVWETDWAYDLVLWCHSTDWLVLWKRFLISWGQSARNYWLWMGTSKLQASFTFMSLFRKQFWWMKTILILHITFDAWGNGSNSFGLDCMSKGKEKTEKCGRDQTCWWKQYPKTSRIPNKFLLQFWQRMESLPMITRVSLVDLSNVITTKSIQTKQHT